jgi:hypothetical protein
LKQVLFPSFLLTVTILFPLLTEGDEMSRVVQVVCRGGGLVDQIKFVMSDGEERSFGGDGGSEQEPFDLDENEVITKIEGTHREWADHRGQTLLGCFRVKTSTGKYSPWYGQVSGDSDNLENPKLGWITCVTTAENPIVGLENILPGFIWTAVLKTWLHTR